MTDRDMRVRGGLLVQDRDEDIELRDEMEVVTERKPTEQEWGEMLFAWKVCKHVARTRSCWPGISRRSVSAPAR